MASHRNAVGPARPRQFNSETDETPNANDDGLLTFSGFMGVQPEPEWPSEEFERRQRRRIETQSPPQYRYMQPSNPNTGRVIDRPTVLWSTEGGGPNRPPSIRPGVLDRLPSMPTNAVRERASLEPVPKWQPDHEVSACPVCKTNFSFFFRKHHCRKCGRVVCNNCSPHRITIPRQYVVQPPTGEDSEVSEAYPARNLGGGEVVRVCNPCVPDPWTPEAAREVAREATNEARPRPQSTSSTSGGDSARLPQRYRTHVGTHAPLPPPAGRVRAQSHQPQPTPNFSRSLPGGPPISTPSFDDRHITQHTPSASSSRPRHRHTQSSAIAPPPYQSYDPRIRPLSAAVAASSSNNPPPYRRERRQVKEEDECPVCGEELPPGDDIRKAHVEECITTRFGTPSQSATLLPNERTSTSTPPAGGARPRASTYRSRGMAVYKATEKDCMNAEGETQECVICFEEFQPGDEMGRMECLCKFHRGCIRQWWETKGPGSCPTHQLHQD